jgi:predicted transcriptional regulator
MTRAKLHPDTHYAAKLTPELAAEVRRQHQEGRTIGELARRLGVSRTAIRAVIEGRTHRP